MKNLPKILGTNLKSRYVQDSQDKFSSVFPNTKSRLQENKEIHRHFSKYLQHHHSAVYLMSDHAELQKRAQLPTLLQVDLVHLV
jgi:hypothetical protein